MTVLLLSTLQVLHPELGRKTKQLLFAKALCHFLTLWGLYGPITEEDPGPLLCICCMQSAEDLGPQVFSPDHC